MSKPEINANIAWSVFKLLKALLEAQDWNTVAYEGRKTVLDIYTQLRELGIETLISPILRAKYGIALDSIDAGEIQNLILSGKKIQAIKLFREKTGQGLKESKEICDDADVFKQYSLETDPLHKPRIGTDKLQFGQ